jgi:hypothetical protein
VGECEGGNGKGKGKKGEVEVRIAQEGGEEGRESSV